MRTLRALMRHQNRLRLLSRAASPHRRRVGFALLEILVTIMILSILGGAIIVTMFSGQRSHLSMETSTLVKQQVWRAFDQMRELEKAYNLVLLNTPCASCGLQFQIPVGYAAGSTTWGAFDKDGQGRPGYRVQYRLDTSTGQRQLLRVLQDQNGVDVSSEPKRVVANFVEDPALFSPLFEVNANMVKIRLQITTQQDARLAGGKRTSGLLTTRFYVRNAPAP